MRQYVSRHTFVFYFVQWCYLCDGCVASETRGEKSNRDQSRHYHVVYMTCKNMPRKWQKTNMYIPKTSIFENRLTCVGAKIDFRKIDWFFPSLKTDPSKIDLFVLAHIEDMKQSVFLTLHVSLLFSLLFSLWCYQKRRQLKIMPNVKHGISDETSLRNGGGASQTIVDWFNRWCSGRRFLLQKSKYRN